MLARYHVYRSEDVDWNPEMAGEAVAASCRDNAQGDVGAAHCPRRFVYSAVAPASQNGPVALFHRFAGQSGGVAAACCEGCVDFYAVPAKTCLNLLYDTFF